MGDDATPGELTAVIEHLTQSGLALTTHGETMAHLHGQADAALETAVVGWRGRSAAALTARSQEWSATTTSLPVRLGSHAEHFHTCSLGFTHMVDVHVEALGAVDRM